MLRWTLVDTVTSDTVVLPWNPNQMSSPYAPRNTRTQGASPVDGAVRAVRPKAGIKDWTFGGFIRAQAHYELLQSWVERGVPVELTDHLGMTFLVRLVQFRPQERQPTRLTTWRFTYEMQATVLRRIA